MYNLVPLSLFSFCFLYQLDLFYVLAEDTFEEHVHRVKRSSGSSPLSATLEVSDIFINVTEVRIADKIPLRFTFTIPEVTSQFAVVFESSIHGGENVFFLCSGELHYIGANIQGLSIDDVATTFYTSSANTYDVPGPYNDDAVLFSIGTNDTITNYGSNSTDCMFDYYCENSTAVDDQLNCLILLTNTTCIMTVNSTNGAINIHYTNCVNGTDCFVTNYDANSTVVIYNDMGCMVTNLCYNIEYGANDSVVYLSDSQIEIDVNAVVVNSAVFTAGEYYCVNATATFDTSQVDDGICFTAVEQSLFSITPPLFNLTGPAGITIGDAANWTISMNLRDATNKIHIEAWVNGTYTYPACHYFPAYKGLNYECFQDSSTIVTVNGSRLQLDIASIINTGFNYITISDSDNDVIINVLTRIPRYVTPSDDLNLNIEVYVDDKLYWDASETLIPSYGSLLTPTGGTNLTVGTLDGVDTIAIGSGLIFTVDVTTPPGSVNIYKATLDAGLATICDVQFMRMGDHVCMDNHVTYSATGAANEVETDKFDVVNAFTNAHPNDIENEFRLEVTVCLPTSSPVTVGDSLTLTVNLDDGVNPSADKTHIFTVVDSSAPALATGSINFSNPITVQGNISNFVQMSVIAIVTKTTDKFNLTVEVPVHGGSALATIESIAVSTGSNFACIYNQSVGTISEEVFVSHTQRSKITYDLGVVFNSGLHDRNPYLTSNGTENDIEIGLLLRVSDHAMNTMGSVIEVDTALSGDSGIVATGTNYIQVDTSGVETPDLVFVIEMESFQYFTKQSGDNITFDIQLYHSTFSSASAHDVVVHFISPFYVSFGEMLSEINAIVTQTTLTPDLGITFLIPEIDFTDHVNFSFSVVLDPNRQMPIGLENLRTVVPVDMTYRGPIRTDRINTGVLHSGLIIKEFGFDTELPSALGLNIRTIQDCQITASSSINTHMPSEARLFSTTGWKPAVRGSPFCQEEYLQINLGNPAFITGIELQSSTNSYDDIVTSFRLQYSDDDIAWYDVNDEDNINPLINTIDLTLGGSVNDVYEVKLNDTYRFTAQYLRLVPLMPSCTFGLRLELKGLMQSGPAVDCSAVPNSISPVGDQSYIVNAGTGTTFVCGSRGIGKEVSCSRTGDISEYWQETDDSIANVIGMITDTAVVVGLSVDGINHLRSDDDGFTWDVITAEELTELQSDSGYVAMIAFPYEGTRSQTYNDLYSTYGADGDDFTMTGCIEGIAATAPSAAWNVVAWWGTEDWSLY